jgi:hypothetical protein
MTRIDVWIPAALGASGLVTMLVLAERHPEPSAFQVRVYLVLLAVSAAAFAAIIPGLLHIKLNIPGLTLRAAGALAVFCIVFFYEPAHQSLAKALGVIVPVTVDSGWKGGGSSPATYCREQLEPLKKQYPGRKITLVDTKEDHKAEYTPFKRDYYRYQCFFVVE